MLFISLPTAKAILKLMSFEEFGFQVSFTDYFSGVANPK
jgi:hypothetical protein